METADLDAQVVALAFNVKGEESCAPLVGAVTVIFDTGAETTVMLSRASEFTFWPQHLTCRTCAPRPAVTEALNEVGSMIAVPLSIE